MGSALHNSALTTGANTGLGKDLARQLALRGDFSKIYLACRNPAKAQAAQSDLTRIAGKSIFDVAIAGPATGQSWWTGASSNPSLYLSVQ